MRKKLNTMLVSSLTCRITPATQHFTTRCNVVSILISLSPYYYFKAFNPFQRCLPFLFLAGMLKTAYALIRLGARIDITDDDGLTAVECSSNKDVNRAVSRYCNYWRR